MTAGDRIRALQAEARLASAQAAWAALTQADKLALEAHEISEMGDALPAGVRHEYGQLAKEMKAKAETIRALLTRHQV